MSDIATLNDKFRRSFINGEVLLSAGIAAMSSEDKANIISMVQNFNDFNDDNDVYGEHDFFSIDYKGNKIFAKIDYYDLNYEFMSENPANPSVTNLIMTIMLAEEY
ncbi:MAG: DUF3768 domain-containing protein [Alphaproteobacteria bacterium]|nr:DUF3768 domain-containing protein [Alphaproteobacteria bacterium]